MGSSIHTIERLYSGMDGWDVYESIVECRFPLYVRLPFLKDLVQHLDGRILVRRVLFLFVVNFLIFVVHSWMTQGPKLLAWSTGTSGMYRYDISLFYSARQSQIT